MLVLLRHDDLRFRKLDRSETLLWNSGINFGRTIKIVMPLSACSWRSERRGGGEWVCSVVFFKGCVEAYSKCGSFSCESLLVVDFLQSFRNVDRIWVPFSEIPNLSGIQNFSGKVLVCGRVYSDSASDGLRGWGFVRTRPWSCGLPRSGDFIELVRYDAVLRDSGVGREFDTSASGEYVDQIGEESSVTEVLSCCRLRFDPYKRGIKLAMVFLASKSLLSWNVIATNNMTRIIISGACRFPAIGIQL
jgi:hypothetical protein